MLAHPVALLGRQNGASVVTVPFQKLSMKLVEVRYVEGMQHSARLRGIGQVLPPLSRCYEASLR
jgi:hypothetical protein